MRILSPLLASPPFDLVFGSLVSGYYPPFATYRDPNGTQYFYDNGLSRLADVNGITPLRDNEQERIIDPNNRNGFEYRG